MFTPYVLRELLFLCTGIGSVLAIGRYPSLGIRIGITKEKLVSEHLLLLVVLAGVLEWIISHFDLWKCFTACGLFHLQRFPFVYYAVAAKISHNHTRMRRGLYVSNVLTFAAFVSC